MNGRSVTVCQGGQFSAYFLVGGSVLELVTDSRHKDRLTSTLKVIVIIHIPNFDIAKASKNRQMRADNDHADVRSLFAMMRRLQSCTETCRKEIK